MLKQNLRTGATGVEGFGSGVTGHEKLISYGLN